MLAKTPWKEQLQDRIAYWAEWLAEHFFEAPKATIDFETRSEVNLKVQGAWKYSRHPSTEAMCLSFHLPGEDDVGLWHCGTESAEIEESELPLELFAFILAGGLVEAHNAFFERCIWNNIMVPRHGWPDIGHLQWRCSASRASAVTLPRALEEACKVMGLPIEKDMEGNRLMLKMCKPRKLRKAERIAWREKGYDPAKVIIYHEEAEDLRRQWEYCKNDVRAECALSATLPELSAYELKIWQMDQALNEKGGRFDLAMAESALDMARKWKGKLNEELEAITGINSGSKRAALKDWLLEHEGLDLPDTKGETLEIFLDDPELDLSGRARRVIEIIMDVNKTSTRKYKAMIDKADPDDWRIRDLLMYCGAGTGRWAGKGVQVHNFPARNLIVKDFDEAAEVITENNLPWARMLYGDIMKLLSHALRAAIIPEDGCDIIVADYSAIEARCVLWEAAAEQALDVFRRGEDIYCDMASGIYGFTVTKANNTERQFGKQAILGLGYGMGFITFLLTCRKYGIHFSKEDARRIMGPQKMVKYIEWVKDYLWIGTPDELLEKEEAMEGGATNKKRQASQVKRQLKDAREVPEKILHELALMKYVVDVYRKRYPQVKDMWSAQESAAIRAIQDGATVIKPVVEGKVEWFQSTERTVTLLDGTEFTVPKGKFLHCRLPSRRLLSYVDAHVKPTRTSWGQTKPGLRYYRVGLNNKWERTHTYGGKLVENITQAVARDIMADAMLRAYEGGVYWPIMSVHDEMVCEVPKDKGDLKEYEHIMSDIEPWAAGCPIDAEAWRAPRYRK